LLSQVRALVGHRDAVTALSFRSCGSNVAQYGNTTNTTHTLYSGSLDRTVKLWDCDQLGYIETLFGHQASITSLDSLIHERALSAGGIDRSVRLWKIPEESQLVFQSDPVAMSIETARMLNEQLYVSGSQDGTLALWLQVRFTSSLMFMSLFLGSFFFFLCFDFF
jgi:ribosomal RNA-processing protein 9